MEVKKLKITLKIHNDQQNKDFCDNLHVLHPFPKASGRGGRNLLHVWLILFFVFFSVKNIVKCNKTIYQGAIWNDNVL